jgi:hypothetical protein
MSEQPEALLIAELWDDYLPAYNYKQVALDTARELRRLHEENELLARACDKIRVMHREEIKPLLDVHSLNLELLDALKYVIRGVPDTWDGVIKARAAIAKAEGKE